MNEGMFRSVVKRAGHTTYVSRPFENEEEAKKKAMGAIYSLYGPTMADHYLGSGELTVNIYPANEIHPISGERIDVIQP